MEKNAYEIRKHNTNSGDYESTRVIRDWKRSLTGEAHNRREDGSRTEQRNTKLLSRFSAILPPFPKDLPTYYFYRYQGKSSCVGHGVSKVGERKGLR